MKDILFFDFDGTIYSRKNETVTDEVKEAIKKVKKLGNIIVLATDRPYSQIPQDVRDLDFDAMVLSHGSHLKLNNKDLEIKYLNKDNLKKLCQAFDQNHIEYALYDLENTYLEENSKDLYPFYKTVNLNEDKIVFRKNRENVLDNCIKMEFWVKDENDQKLAEELTKDFKIYGFHNRKDLYEKGQNKSNGIKRFLDYFKDEYNRSIAFGDSRNDRKSFKLVDLPIAMQNGHEDTKAVAKEICRSVDENGVYYKLKELYNL